MAVAAPLTEIVSGIAGVGTNIRTSGEYDPFKELAKLAEALAPAQAKVQEESGDQHAKLGDYPAAVEAYQKALVPYRHLGDRAKVMTILGNIGRLQVRQGQHDEAMANYNEALNFARDIGDVEAEGHLHQEIGRSYRLRKKYEPARNAYEQALAAFHQVGAPDARRKVLTDLFATFYFSGQLTEGITYFEERREAARERHDRTLELHMLRGAASLAMALRRCSDALPVYDQALAIAVDLADVDAEGLIYRSIGACYLMEKEYGEARDAFERALTAFQQTGNVVVRRYVLEQMFRTFSRSGQFAEGKVYFENQFSAARKSNDRALAMDLLRELAGLASYSQPLVEVLPLLNEALAIARDIADVDAEGRTHRQIGGYYERRKKYEEARVAYERALTAYQKTDDADRREEVLERIAGTFYEPRQLAEGAGYFERHLKAARDRNDRAFEMALLRRVADFAAYTGRLEDALRRYNEALAIETNMDDPNLEGDVLIGIGYCLAQQSQYELAQNAYERALASFQRIGDSGASRDAVERIAQLYLRLDRPTEGISYCEQVLKAARERNDRALEGKVLITIADLEARRSRFAAALRRYREGLVIVRNEGDRPSEAAALEAIGDVYSKLGSIDQALIYHEQALNLAEAIGSTGTTADALLRAGRIYHAKGQFGEAIKNFARARDLYREIDDISGVATALYELGGAYAAEGNYDKAIEHWEQAARAYREDGNKLEILVLGRMAVLHGSRRQFQQALAFADRVSAGLDEMVDGPTKAALLTVVAATKCLSGRCDDAVAQTLRAISIVEGADTPELRWQSWVMLETVLVYLERFPSAIIAGKQAVNILQEVRTANLGMEEELLQGFVGTQASVYRGLADLLIHEGRIAEAEQVLAMLKEKEYLDFIQRDAEEQRRITRIAYTRAEQAWWNRYADSSRELVRVGRRYGELERQQALSDSEKAELAALESALDDAQERFLEVLAALKAEFEDQGPRALSLGERQLDFLESLQPKLAELGPGTVLIHTVVTTDRLHLILTTPDVRLARQSPISEADLNDLVARFRRTLQQRRGDPRPVARELYAHLVEPLEADLAQAEARTLMWSLDGALRYIPLAALHDGQRYLVERFPIALYTPAAQVKLARPGGDTWKVAGLGVSRPHAGFRALAAVPQELEGIVKRSDTDADGVVPGVVYLDEYFDRDGLKQVLRERYPVVHIASHFLLGPADERSSFLLLGDGSRLSLEDFRKGRAFSLNGVELLTLSACSTAMGSGDQAGGEVESFGVLAQKRGAGGVIATLWPVADRSTAVFMEHFYRLRSEEPMLTKAEALRRAQLTLLRGGLASQYPEKEGERGLKRLDTVADTASRHGQRPFAHPYYWAPFILMGNWL